MNLIKELFEIRIAPIQRKSEVWRGLVVGAILLFLISWWRGQWAPILVATPIWLFMALFPRIAARALTGLKVLLAYFFHGLNLILLSIVYLGIVTPMGLIRRLSASKRPWREEPTEIPTKESFLRPY